MGTLRICTRVDVLRWPLVLCKQRSEPALTDVFEKAFENLRRWRISTAAKIGRALRAMIRTCGCRQGDVKVAHLAEDDLEVNKF
jgi:hypothetical protein